MRRPCVASVLVIVVAAATHAQVPPPAAGPVFRSGAELVALNVAVLDSERKFVRGLTSQDFAVFEDGVQQDVSFFAASQVPLDLCLLLDSSASMTANLKTVHEAALGFVKTLRDGDRGAVVSFSDGVQIVQPLTHDISSLERAVQSTEARGATALNNAIYIALKEFGRATKQSGEVRRQAIAVLSDGDDTASLISFEDVLGEAKKRGVNIYTISLRGEPSPSKGGTFSTALYSMRTLAQETGGQAFFPMAVGELRDVYARIADDLENQYSLGYSPKNRRPDGRFRRVVVKVVSRPELRPRARTGYFAQSASAAPWTPVNTARVDQPRPRER